MRARGSVVILKNLAYRESKIELTEQAKQSMMEESLATLVRLPILHIGEQVTDLKVGEEVYVDPMRLMSAIREVIDEEAIIIVRSSDVQFVY